MCIMKDPYAWYPNKILSNPVYLRPNTNRFDYNRISWNEKDAKTFRNWVNRNEADANQFSHYWISRKKVDPNGFCDGMSFSGDDQHNSTSNW